MCKNEAGFINKRQLGVSLANECGLITNGRYRHTKVVFSQMRSKRVLISNDLDWSRRICLIEGGIDYKRLAKHVSMLSGPFRIFMIPSSKKYGYLFVREGQCAMNGSI